MESTFLTSTNWAILLFVLITPDIWSCIDGCLTWPSVKSTWSTTVQDLRLALNRTIICRLLWCLKVLSFTFILIDTQITEFTCAQSRVNISYWWRVIIIIIIIRLIISPNNVDYVSNVCCGSSKFDQHSILIMYDDSCIMLVKSEFRECWSLSTCLSNCRVTFLLL